MNSQSAHLWLDVSMFCQPDASMMCMYIMVNLLSHERDAVAAAATAPSSSNKSKAKARWREIVAKND